MAFRFHLHDLSPKGVDETSGIEAQREANSQNEALAKRVDYIFYEDKETIDGFFVGGMNKEKEILHVACPINLQEDEDGPTRLSIFLHKAYKLLRQHYLAINHEDLKPYAVPSLIMKKNIKKDTGRKKKPRIIKVIRNLGEEVSSDSEPEPDSEAPPPLPPVKPRRVLDNHKAMFKLFTSAFLDENGEEMDTDEFGGDKTFDQFDGLIAIIGEEMKKDTGSYSNLRKRKSGPSYASQSAKNPRVHQHSRKSQGSSSTRSSGIGGV